MQTKNSEICVVLIESASSEEKARAAVSVINYENDINEDLSIIDDLRLALVSSP